MRGAGSAALRSPGQRVCAFSSVVIHIYYQNMLLMVYNVLLQSNAAMTANNNLKKVIINETK